MSRVAMVLEDLQKKSLKWGCHPTTYWMRLLRVGPPNKLGWRSDTSNESKPSSRVDLRVGEIPQRSCLPSRKNPIIRIWMKAPKKGGIPRIGI